MRTPELARSQRKAYIARSFDLASADYDEANGDFFNPVAARLVDLSCLRFGDRVLDVGCGRGAVLFAAAEAVGPDGFVAGVDLSPEMAHRTAAEAARRGLRNVSVRVDDAEDLGFPACSFEAVLSSMALFLTPDPAAALASVHRILVPGGRLGFTVFGTGGSGWDAPLAAVRPFLGPPPAAGGARPPAAPGGGRGPRPVEPGPLDDPDSAAALLADAGFTEVRTVEEEVAVEYADAGACWRALWAGGFRAMLETIPAERREDARRAVFAALEPLAEDGHVVRRTAVRYTTARRSG